VIVRTAGDSTPHCSWELSEFVLLVKLIGAIDAAVTSELRAVAEVAGRQGFRTALVDLSEVTFFGAAGLNFLAGLAASGRTVQLVEIPQYLQIDRMLKAVGLERRMLY
jgi:anti-anti-sigma factor